MTPHPKRRSDRIDELVGRNIRLLRESRGISQTELGRKVGVTFQQVQKYESGANRVASGRLFKIAALFGVPLKAFFEGAKQAMADGEGNGHAPAALLAKPYALRLATAFCAMPNLDVRRSFVELIEGLSNRKASR